MLIKTILNRVHPIKGFLYTKVHFNINNGNEIVATIEHRQNSKGRCSLCEKSSPGYDRLPERRFDFIPLWNIPVSLAYRPRRVSCKEHGVIVEKFPWSRGKERSTFAFQIFLSQWAKHLSWTEVAARFKTTWDTVYDAIKRTGMDWSTENLMVLNL
jgi:transposase